MAYLSHFVLRIIDIIGSWNLLRSEKLVGHPPTERRGVGDVDVPQHTLDYKKFSRRKK